MYGESSDAQTPRPESTPPEPPRTLVGSKCPVCVLTEASGTQACQRAPRIFELQGILESVGSEFRDEGSEV